MTRNAMLYLIIFIISDASNEVVQILFEHLPTVQWSKSSFSWAETSATRLLCFSSSSVRPKNLVFLRSVISTLSRTKKNAGENEFALQSLSSNVHCIKGFFWWICHVEAGQNNLRYGPGTSMVGQWPMNDSHNSQDPKATTATATPIHLNLLRGDGVKFLLLDYQNRNKFILLSFKASPS